MTNSSKEPSLISGYINGVPYSEFQKAKSFALLRNGVQLGTEIVKSEPEERQGLCVDMPSYPFFPSEADTVVNKKGDSLEDAKAKIKRENAARAICNRCVVQESCLDYAIENKISGFAGGMNDKERDRLVSQKRWTERLFDNLGNSWD